MSKLKLKFIYSCFSSLLLLDLLAIYINSVKGETKYNGDYDSENISLKINDFKNSFANNLEVNSSIKFNFKKQLKEDILKHGNKFIYLLALEEKSNNSSFDIDIESDIQYEKDNLYYAEGNVIVNFLNSSLKGDKLIYDKINKTLNIQGNVVFSKGNQYFEATQVFYNLILNEGFINNIYGIIDSKTLVNDFEFKNVKPIKNLNNFDDLYLVEDIEYINSAKVGLVNNFQNRKNFNMAKFNFNIPSISKWRYKSKQIILKNEFLQSDNILFTNDAINKPQFILKSNNFTGEIVNQKIKLVSRESYIILDEKLVLPIGKRTIFEKEESSTWGIGSDFKEKDGLYISRSFNNVKINERFKINYEPHFLLQRAIKGSTESFPAKNKSLLTKKIKDDIEISDLLALDTEIKGNIGKWYLNWESKLNSLNPDRLYRSFRTKFTLKKTLDLNSYKLISNNNLPNNDLLFQDSSKDYIFNNNKSNIYSEYQPYQTDENKQNEIYKNYLDIKISSSFREKISKGYSGESEIYFGNSLNIVNRRLWLNKGNNTKINFIYDFGKFKAKAKSVQRFHNLYRNVFAIQVGNKYPLLKIKSEDKNINSDYKYTPSIISQGLNWNNNIESGIFLYSNGKSQEAISFSTGPSITFGKFKKDFLDFTNIDIRNIYVLKNGQSPFSFDDINKNFRVNLELKQQIFGPLVFSYGTSYKFEEGTFMSPRYGLDISRRAYSFGLFYDSQNERAGLQFNIFNFDFKGINSSF